MYLCLKVCLSQEKLCHLKQFIDEKSTSTHKMYKASIKKVCWSLQKVQHNQPPASRPQIALLLTILGIWLSKFNWFLSCRYHHIANWWHSRAQLYHDPQLKLINSGIRKRKAKKTYSPFHLETGLQTLVLNIARLQNHHVIICKHACASSVFFSGCVNSSFLQTLSTMLLPTCHLRMWQRITTWSYH